MNVLAKLVVHQVRNPPSPHTSLQRLNSSLVVLGLPRAHLLTVESISTTTLEFLRHFWSAILPPKPNDTSAFASASPKERAERAKKFKEYLEKSRERVGKALIDAKGDGEELGKRVEAVRTLLSLMNSRGVCELVIKREECIFRHCNQYRTRLMLRLKCTSLDWVEGKCMA